MVNITSAIGKSIDNSDNYKKQRNTIFLVNFSRHHKVIGTLKCFETSSQVKSSKIYLSVTHNSFILRILQCYIYCGQSILTYETLSRKHSIELYIVKNNVKLCRLPSKHEPLNQCRINAGRPSIRRGPPLNQHRPNASRLPGIDRPIVYMYTICPGLDPHALAPTHRHREEPLSTSP